MKLPVLKAKEVVKALVNAGFQISRRKGSHICLAKIDPSTKKKLCTVVPVHNGNEIARGLLKDIINQSGMTKEEFLSYL